MQCKSLRHKPQISIWGFFLIFSLGCAHSVDNDGGTSSSSNIPFDPNSIFQDIRLATYDYAISEGYTVSFNKHPKFPNDGHISINSSQNFPSTLEDSVSFHIQNILEAFSKSEEQLELCITIAKENSAYFPVVYCHALYTSSPLFGQEKINIKAESYLHNKVATSLVDYNRNSLEWQYLLSFLDKKLSPKDIRELNLLYRFDESQNKFLKRRFINIQSIDKNSTLVD